MVTRAGPWLVVLLAACRGTPPAAPSGQAGSTAPAAGELAITYVANEGVLLESDGVRVLIDALVRPNRLHYSVLPDGPREAIETAVPPWEGIDLVLVSHMHADHFHAEAVGRHLARAGGARLVSSEEVVGLVEDGFPDWGGIRDRVQGIAWEVGRKETVTAGGATVTFVGLSHGSGPVATVQNFGHLVRIGRWKVFHGGDAVPSTENFAGSGLAEEGIDVALLPWWHIASAPAVAVVRLHLAPKRIVLIHVAPSEEQQVEEAIRAFAPDAVMFRRMLEDRLRL
jgi:L-ascorbate metabolism protein UlaG (beta-lactamase superfamily)